MKPYYRSSRKWFNILFLCCWGSKTILRLPILLIGKLPIIGSYNENIFNIFIFILVILALKEFRYFRGKDLFIIFLMILSVLVSLLKGGNLYFSENIMALIFSVFPFYFIGRHFDIHDKLLIKGNKYLMEQLIYIFSFLGIVYMFFMQWYSLRTGSYNSIFENSSAATYSKLLLGYCCFYLFKNKKIHSFFIVIFGFIAMVSYGNRASLLATLIMFFLASIFYIDLRKRKTLLLLFCEMLCIVLIIVNFSALVQFVGNILSIWGFNVRIIDMFGASGNLTGDNGRLPLYENAKYFIERSRIGGYGLYSDRVLLGDYVHNVFLEFLLDFGPIVGIILSVCLIILIVIGIKNHIKDKDFLGFLIVLIASEMIMLMVSGSYLQEGFFFMLIGMCLSDKKINYTSKYIGK